MLGKGLDLCRRYFEAEGRKLFEMLEDAAGEHVFSKLAFGLVGEGSDCFGYDDEISRDHDWGPAFCVWYDEEDASLDPAALMETYNKLPTSFENFERLHMPEAEARVGVCSIQSFYKRLIGVSTVPSTAIAWLNIPESALATATNGEVFLDPAGKFSAIRNALLAFYPSDVRLKKLAARLATLGQAGQYNLARCLQRKDWIGARHAVDTFVQHYISCAHLLEFKYRPYYKWASCSMADLADWAEEHQQLIALSQASLHNEQELLPLIESLSAALISRLPAYGISTSASDFLPHQAAVVQNQIIDVKIRSLALMLG